MLRLRIGFVLIAMVLSVFGARLVQLQGIDPQLVRRDGGRRGHRRRGAARPSAATSSTATGSRWPTRSAGRMVVADPQMTARTGPPSSPGSCPSGWTSTTSTPSSGSGSRTAGSSTSPAACPRPWPPTSSRRPRTAGFEGVCTRARPGARLPGRRRRRQPDRDHGDRRAAGRLRAHLRRPARRHRRVGALPGRRAATGSRWARTPSSRRSTAHDLLHHHRPRPAVVRPAGAAPDRRGRPRRLRHRDRDGLPHRRDPGAGRPPDVRREQADRVRRGARPARGPSRTSTSRARWRRC